MAGEPSKGGDRGNTPASDPRHRVLTAKLPPELIDALGEEARSRGSRATLLFVRHLRGFSPRTHPCPTMSAGWRERLLGWPRNAPSPADSRRKVFFAPGG